MTIPEWPSGTGCRVLTLAGNDLTIDARARKTAISLAADGSRVIALGLDASGSLPRSSDLGGANLVRVTPRTDPRLSPQWFRWSYSGLIDTLRFESEIQRQRLQSSRRNLTADNKLRGDRLAGGRSMVAAVTNRVLRAARVDNGTRARLIDGIDRRWRLAFLRAIAARRRLQTIAIQRRYQAISTIYRVAVRTSDRRTRHFRRWRKDLPELHQWEAAIGPLVDALQPDLVHCHDIFHLGLAVRARARAAQPFAVVYDAQEFIPGLPSFPWRRAAYASLEREYIRHADAIVTVSGGLADLLHGEYGVDAKIVLNAPNREETPDVRPVRDVIGLDDDARLVSFVGGLAPDRGAEVVVDALNHLPNDIHVVFVTNAVGGYRDQLVEITRQRGVANRVHFAPFVAPEAVTAYISSSDASVIALSRGVINYEIALPNKLFQAIHARVPVVVSDNPEMARFVEAHGVGRSFRGGDPESLACAIEVTLNERPTFLDRLGDSKLLDDLSWERQFEVLTTVYAAALETTP